MDIVRRHVRRAWIGAALVLLAPAAPAAGSGPGLYVGDSLGVGTHPQLAALLRGVPIAGDTRIGRTSTEGLAVLRSKLRRVHRIAIFDLGSNDARPATLARNLERARALTGERLMVVLTLNKPGAGRFNRAIRAFARSTSNVALVDWHATAGREQLLAGDGIHASATGYRRRATLIADAISRPAAGPSRP